MYFDVLKDVSIHADPTYKEPTAFRDEPMFVSDRTYAVVPTRENNSVLREELDELTERVERLERAIKTREGVE